MGQKVSFSYDIDSESAELFDKLAQKLGPPKYRIIEAAIEVFNTLPREVQYVLKSYEQPDRQLCLDLLRAIQVPIKPAQSARSAKGVKSA